MLQYKDRAPRLDLSFPLEFHDGELTVAGHCLNVSESGLLANFDQPLDLWSQGRLQLHFGESTFAVGARVARTVGREAGLAFLFHADAERAAVRAMCAFTHGNTLLGTRPPF